MPFHYESSVDPRQSATIADLMLRRGDIAAHAAQQNGAIWGGAIQNIGQMVGALPGQIALAKRAQLQDQIGAQQLADMKANAAERETQHTEQDFARHQALTSQIGLALHDRLRPDDPTNNLQAMQEALDAAERNKLITSEQAQQFGAMASADPSKIPEVAKSWAGLTPAGRAEIEKTITAKPGEVTTSRWDGSPVGTPLPEARKTAAELAADAANPNSPTQAQSATALDLMRPPKPEPVRTEADKALDAYAKSIGKTKAEDLTYGERQTFDKNKATITASAEFQKHVNERNYDNAHPAPVKDADQGKLEQQYRTVLTRAMSSRSGGIGAEDAKVQQANHLLALLHQTYDPNTDTYNIPKTLQGELAAGLARLVAPGGSVGIEMMREFNQKTAKGDLAGALSYVTGHPFPTATNDFAKLLKDSIERQGKVAEENREGEMRYLRGLAPTELEETRRQALEATSLNPLRQSRVIQKTGTNERKLQVSTDGGKTWQ
jgi:hypothetical protein